MARTLLLGFLMLLAPLARADVAVAVTLPDQNAAHREVAGGLVEALATEWTLLTPPLRPEAVDACRGEVQCLRALAAQNNASHLVILGIAGLGARDLVLTAQVWNASGIRLADETAVVTGSAVPRRDGLSLLASLKAVEGMPSTTRPDVLSSPSPSPSPPSAAALQPSDATSTQGPPEESGISGIPLLGASLLMAGGATALATWVGANLISVDASRDALAVGVMASGAVLALGLSGAGLGLIGVAQPSAMSDD